MGEEVEINMEEIEKLTEVGLIEIDIEKVAENMKIGEGEDIVLEIENMMIIVIKSFLFL